VLHATRAPLRIVVPVDDSPCRRRRQQIKATTHDGVVEITIPLPKEAKKQTITITPTAG